MSLAERPAAADRANAESGRVVDIATGAPIAPPPTPHRPLGNAAAYAALGVIAGILGAATFWTLLDARANRPAPPGSAAAAGPAVFGQPPYVALPPADYPGLLPFPPGAAPLGPIPGELPAPPQQTVLPGDGPVFAAPESMGPVAGPAALTSAAPPPGRRQAPTLIFDSGNAAAGSDLVVPDAQPAPDAEPAPPEIVSKTGPKPGRVALTRGTVIPAVLESAIDTAQPGGVRAMVSVDVRSTDGRALLVPRGSRIYGQYRTGGSSGAARAEVSWTRLQRPDGTSENLGGAVVSQLAAAPGEDSSRVRVRPGEPIRIMAARSVEVAPAAR